MDFSKIPPACNFIYSKEETPLLACADSPYETSLEALGGDVFRYSIKGASWPQKSQATLDTASFNDAPSSSVATVDKAGALHFSYKGEVLLNSMLGQAFGVLGKKWLLGFQHNESMRLYGLGEKNTGLEKTGQITKFWNTDTMADFGPIRVQHESTDPFYVTIPYLLIQQPNGCIGILLNNPMPTFMNLAAKEHIANLADAKDNEQPSITMGAYGGAPEFYFIMGDDVRTVTRKLMRLSGPPPLPPLWAIGYQQSRWGYRDLSDLEELDQKFNELGIPCDGLWLDIDYMDAYKVFTVNESIARDYQTRISALQAKGRKIVPIIDPGVKYLPGYDVFDSGHQANAFCRTEEGNTYSGFVWPGRTAFPDFSMSHARKWWSDQVKAFTDKYQFDGYWLDMNDPSTGSAELEDMRFNDGQDDHQTYHNQYALGMQQATAEGLMRSRPQQRPFLISRSGYISSSRHSAIWTGDNWSNYFHLREGIAVSLNLSLSGIPFNGPDVPGFEGEASPELAVDWHKAGFLFPFFRNHSAMASPRQEPWQFEQPYRDIIVHYIRLRYKLLPYLYQLFIQQTEVGDPLLRPVFYEYPDEIKRFQRVSDQFMVGPSILQAPKVHETEAKRCVQLPDCGWYDATQGKWYQGEESITITHELASTPLFFREGSLVPMSVGEAKSAKKELYDIEIHVFKRKHDTSRSTFEYRFDDGETVNGPASCVYLAAHCEDDILVVEVTQCQLDYLPLTIRLVCHDSLAEVIIKQNQNEEHYQLIPSTVTFTGKPINCTQTEAILLSSHPMPLVASTR
ncbi:glycoside hydrolase family 31 protein [Cerasicoccus arenae]|uniref:Alpha-glucosidase n=1 Tax=Cerasicoccus arenae TaxID=424488 RepID=A0A8J3DGW5_9BACT|nr:glycoside hydrolase family 31 protein [Cerasicoccus arenae]MBK1857277.1 hypothetical protein [Cerasicoccus arenae]GHC00422.1 alpha-glucosidase [Cerasicoccus arenae]